MANYSQLKAAIADVIKTNGTQAITGQVLQDVLNSMVSVIGANYTFVGVATPSTNPGTPDQNVFYIAMQGGMYTNFDNAQLPKGISLLMWNGSWTPQIILYNDGGVFDISAYNTTDGTLAEYEDIAEALGTNGVNVPEGSRKGGMSVKFVQSSDHKYVQYRLTYSEWSSITSWWERELPDYYGTKVDAIVKDMYNHVSVTIPSNETRWIIQDNNVWNQTAYNTYRSKTVSIKPGKLYKLNANPLTYYALFKTYEPVTGESVDFATGYEKPVQLIGETFFIAPNDATILFFYSKYNNDVIDISLTMLDTYIVSTYLQEFSNSQKEQARKNINALDERYVGVVTNLSISKETEESNYIDSSGIWALGGTNGASIVIKISPQNNYRLSVTTIGCMYAILKTNNRTIGTAADFATGYSGRTWIQPGGYADFNSSDGEYLYITTKTGGQEVEPTLGFVQDFKTNVIDRLDNLDNHQYVYEEQGINKESESNICINSEGQWAYVGNNLSIIIEIIPDTSYKIITGAIGTLFVPLKTNNRIEGTFADLATGYNQRQWINANSSIEFNSNDGNYLYLTTQISQGTCVYTLNKGVNVDVVVNEMLNGIEISDNKEDLDARRRLAAIDGNSLTPINIPLDSNNYEIPQTREILNVQKKSKQMAHIVWTPLYDIPYNGDSGKLPAGLPVTGLPYSSVKEKDKYIGYDVSIHTFMTAVNNPYSLLYTENVKETTSRSAWGVTYHGHDSCAAYFGTVCSTMTGYCTNQITRWDTAYDNWCAKYRLNMIKIYDQSAQGLQIGDIYWKRGHNRLIMSLARNENGDVTHVITSEATGTHIRENSPITAEAFNNVLASENGIIYRNTELYKNNKYTPSEFVAVGDETITLYVYNNDICTFAGDKACFRSNDLIVLNYNLNGNVTAWTAIEVYKNDVLVETYIIADIDQSALPEGQRGHALNLGSEHTYGKYKARMINGNTYSDYTYWEVLQTEVSYELNDNISHIAWSSANAVAVGYTITNTHGGMRVHNEFSDEDIANGYIDVNLHKLHKQQHNGNDFDSSVPYLKVYFQGEYGRVTNEPLLIDL